jgi:amino acid transporter
MFDKVEIEIRKQTLSTMDAVALIVGIVIGAGIFKTPSLIAANTGNGNIFLLTWLAGGVISVIGALCYAELASTYPHAGGDYHYLTRAFGRKIAFLFGWARMTVIQPGSITILAFVFGDYASQLLPIGNYTSSLYAAIAISILTIVNLVDIRKGKWTQNLLTAAKVIGLLAVVVAGTAFITPPLQKVSPSSNPQSSIGLAMIFVLLTFGGWNEAAYISSELREVRRNMVRVLLWGIGIITVIYFLVGLVFLKGLGLTEMSQSKVVAADLMRRAFGEGGAKFVSFLIAVSALGAINATIFTGGRTNYAMGQDFPMFRFLGKWDERSNTPVNSLLLQGIIILGLVFLGTLTRNGFETMVDYTAPIFWFFFLLTGISLFILRSKEREIDRPFKVPFYPFTPLFFCGTCVYMLHSSLVYTGVGALVGVAVLVTGAILLLLPGNGRPR